MSAIRLQHLEKSYGKKKVLKDVSFSVRFGEIFALLGVNGAGKSSTLECIEGLRRYDGGRIEVNGRLGVQLQSAALPPAIKAGEALRFFSALSGQSLRRDYAEALGCAAFENSLYRVLSTGQKRRLHLAIALMQAPDIIILDEPTAGLDVEGRRALHRLIRTLRDEGKAVLLSSHDMAEVEALSDRLAILDGGRIPFCGTSEELAARTGRQFCIRLKTKSGEKRLLSDRPGRDLIRLLQEAEEQQEDIVDIRVDRGSLEQHFAAMARRNDR